MPVVLIESVRQLPALVSPVAARTITWLGGVVALLQVMAAPVPSVKVTVPVGLTVPASGVTVAFSVTPLAAVAAVVRVTDPSPLRPTQVVSFVPLSKKSTLPVVGSLPLPRRVTVAVSVNAWPLGTGPGLASAVLVPVTVGFV